uniref:Uncharacterized protein n=1 Tax=Brassica oleracea TaxID=3712 RepID=A0A3P6FVB4_BRAOL|nr:unnamed protein product [Brassica oleracea]
MPNLKSSGVEFGSFHQVQGAGIWLGFKAGSLHAQFQFGH